MTRKRREPEIGTIRAVTHDARGIVDGSGKTVFVSGALEGERVLFLRRKSRRNFDEAELIDVLAPSRQRVEPRCAVYGRCGGCAMQHVSAAAQRDIKSGVLEDNLERIGKVRPARWLAPISGPQWQYRRRARLAVKDVAGKGRVLVGFRERHAPFITDMHRCEVLAAPLDGLIDPLSELVGSLSIRRRLPQIETAIGDNGVALVFRVLDPPDAADRAALAAFGERHAVRVYLQAGGPESIEILHPEAAPPLRYRHDGFDVDVRFEPTDFVQVNATVNERMVEAAVELLDIGPDDRVLDLYCGVGNFSLPIARRAAAVTGIEGEASLVRRAADNARHNSIDNATFVTADLDRIDGTERWFADGWDLVLLDPARSGAAEVVRRMQQIGPRRIVYVSCHPATLARDAGVLVNEQGFELEAAGIIDMFPHTAHVESIAVFGAGPERRPGSMRVA